ncbi:hypothetical protein BDQ12DRAFT_599551 [Crucibulum laeve]|uniref:Uncharacterized protein n=1 Tax=Crucibulum laeve TaxID=68775 RepID=A0A5C3M9Y2_9AGAR|nr:hypothetical protein BDQ12DRAFT_599551 [Crucibulum laeve]
MIGLSYSLRTKGLVNLPGITPASKKRAEDLLLHDAENHHCYFLPRIGLHNHLSHHILAAYDLGASATLLQKIYDDDSPSEQPFYLEEKDKVITVTEENWAQYLSNANAYGAFVKFFADQIRSHGVTAVIEKFVFSVDANKDGRGMLVRFVSGALHPFIQAGYGAEFGNDTMIATGLAQTAVHDAVPISIFDLTEPTDQASKGVSLLEVLRNLYDSEALTPPMPYDPDALFRVRRDATVAGERATEIRRICSLYDISGLSDAEIDKKVEECITVSILLMCATGKEGRKPRLDFFLMHLVTSSLFLPSVIKAVSNPVYKVMLIRAFVTVLVLYTLARGRPRLNIDLLMSATEHPRPPINASQLHNPDKSAMGSPLEDEEYNPWPAMLAGVLYHPDPHAIKVMRTFAFATQHYGTAPAGKLTGAFMSGDSSKETHPGTAKMDGTIFVRAAGMMMDYQGWVTYGQKALGDWDRSALGWDAAWDNHD